MGRSVLALILMLGIVPACSDGEEHRPSRAVEGTIIDDRGLPAAGVEGGRLGKARTFTATGEGRLRIRYLPRGTSVIRVGDSLETPTFLYPVTSPGKGVFYLGRGVFLPNLAAGETTSLPSSPSTDLVFAPSSYPGLTLRVVAGTDVTYPAGMPEVMTIIPVATDQMPEPLPPSSATRAAWAVEPFGTTFDPPADITLPNVDGLPAGAQADLLRVDPVSGTWTPAGTLVVDPTGTSLVGGTLDTATILAALPPGPFPTGEITGRMVITGGFPVADYPVLLPGSNGGASGIDGTFRFLPVPLGGGPIRAHIVSHPDVRTETFLVGPIEPAGAVTDLGDLVVQAQAPDRVPPTFSSSPGDDATGVSEHVTISVTFNEAMDWGRTRMEIRSTQGKTDGQILYSTDLRTLRFEPDAPLLNDARYHIIIEETSADLAGNKVPENDRVVSFTTRENPGTPSTSVSVIGIVPREATEGDIVEIVGRNFPGGSTVTVGGMTAQVLSETPTRIRFRVPPDLSAGSKGINAAGVGGASLSLLPTLTSLAPPQGDPGGGYPVLVTGTSLGTGPAIRFHGAAPPLASSQVATGIAFDPVTPTNAIVGTAGGGIYRSVNGGASWTAASGVTETMIRCVAFDPLDPSRAYAGTLGGGVLASVDGGQSWTASTAGLSDLDVLALLPDRSTSGQLAAGTRAGLFRSADFGATWAASDTGLADRTILSLAQDPVATSIWLAGTTGGTYRSTDSGSTWERVARIAGHASVAAIAVDPSGGTAYIGTVPGDVYKTTDSGATWATTTTGLPGAPVVSLAVDPGTPARILAGTLGAGIQTSADGGSTWTAGAASGHVLSIAFDPVAPTNILAATEGSLVLRSTDGGGGYATAAGGIGYGEPRIFVIPGPGVPTGPVLAEVGGRHTRTACFLARRWPDLSGPVVTSVDPPDGASGISLLSDVRIKLSEPVRGDSTFTVTGPGGPLPGTFTVSVQGDTGEVVFLPDTPLPSGASLTVTVSTGVVDLGGNPVSPDFVSAFSTP